MLYFLFSVPGYDQHAAHMMSRLQMTHEAWTIRARRVLEPEHRGIFAVDEHHAFQSRFGRRQRDAASAQLRAPRNPHAMSRNVSLQTLSCLLYTSPSPRDS